MHDFENKLAHSLDHLEDSKVKQAMLYSLCAPAKRLRPQLLYGVLKAYGANESQGDRCAIAIEMIHTYSLIHDDLPCMDNDDLRRGQKTCHKQFDEATALLAGDALLSEAFGYVASATYQNSINNDLASEFVKAIGANGMILGQMIDLLSENVKTDLDTISKIEGSRTLEEAEAPVYLHRDVLRVLESVSGKTLHLLSKSSDETGFTFDGSVSYTPDSAKMDEAWQGTIKITPLTKPQYVDDVYGLCKPTAKFASGIPANVQLETTTGVETIAFTCDPSDATVTASTNASGVVTATVENGAVKITGVSAGSGVVALKATKEGYASWETTIHVVVPQATE